MDIRKGQMKQMPNYPAKEIARHIRLHEKLQQNAMYHTRAVHCLSMLTWDVVKHGHNLGTKTCHEMYMELPSHYQD